jgi:hypothetical protein
LAAVDVKDFARHEAGRFKIKNRLNNVKDITHMADGMQSIQLPRREIAWPKPTRPEEILSICMSLFPDKPLPRFSRSSKIHTAVDSIQAFGMSKSRLISVSMAPRNTAPFTRRSCPLGVPRMASRLPSVQQIFLPQFSIEQAVKLYLSPAHRIGAKPYGSNNNLVSISNHVPDINCEVWDVLHQNLKPLRTFLQIILVVALQFMILKVRSHIRVPRS